MAHNRFFFKEKGESLLDRPGLDSVLEREINPPHPSNLLRPRSNDWPILTPTVQAPYTCKTPPQSCEKLFEQGGSRSFDL